MAKPAVDQALFGYFGFGSLVNRNTLSADVVDVIPVRLKGWRRHWQNHPVESDTPTHLHSIALLSVHPKLECEIDGVLVIDRMSNLAALDTRERSYQRIQLDESNFSFKNNNLNSFSDISVHLYMADSALETIEKPQILRSYLDVVMQGYLREFGEAGLRKFFATTDGFDFSIREDRDNPEYPRHQSLSQEERGLFAELI